jgi:hypothetical protein
MARLTEFHRQLQAIGKMSYSWPLVRLLPMLPHEGTEKIVSRHLLDKSRLICVLRCDAGLLRDLLHQLIPPSSHRCS